MGPIPNALERWNFVVAGGLVGLAGLADRHRCGAGRHPPPRAEARNLRRPPVGYWCRAAECGSCRILPFRIRPSPARPPGQNDSDWQADAMNTDRAPARKAGHRYSGLRNRFPGLARAVTVRREHVLRERTVSHQVADRAMTHQARMVEKSAFAHADQIRDLRRQQHAGVRSRRHSGRNRFAGGDELLEVHRPRQAIDVIRNPGRLELPCEISNLVRPPSPRRWLAP